MPRIVLTLIATLTLAGCGGTSDASDDTVIAAFYPLAYAAERVGGRDLGVLNLTPPGVEPHDLELSGRDAEALARARLVLYLGGGFQPAIEDAVAAGDANGLDLLDEDTTDPHVWLDPTRYAGLASRIGEALDAEERSDELSQELAELDGEFEDGLGDCERREIVTSHAAFGHLAERYDLRQVAITGINPEAEPTPGELRSVVEQVRRSGATTIFFETLVSPRLAETVAREIGAETAVLNPLEGLTEAQAAAGEDYFSVMRANLAALREALGCR